MCPEFMDVSIFPPFRTSISDHRDYGNRIRWFSTRNHFYRKI